MCILCRLGQILINDEQRQHLFFVNLFLFSFFFAISSFFFLCQVFFCIISPFPDCLHSVNSRRHTFEPIYKKLSFLFLICFGSIVGEDGGQQDGNLFSATLPRFHLSVWDNIWGAGWLMPTISIFFEPIFQYSNADH